MSRQSPARSIPLDSPTHSRGISETESTMMAALDASPSTNVFHSSPQSEGNALDGMMIVVPPSTAEDGAMVHSAGPNTSIKHLNLASLRENENRLLSARTAAAAGVGGGGSGVSGNESSVSGGTLMDKDDIIAAAAAASGVDIMGKHKQQKEEREKQQQQQESENNNKPSAKHAGGSARRGGGASSRGSRVGTASAAAGLESSPGAAGSGSGSAAGPAQTGLPGFVKLAARKPTIGGRLAAARIHAGINQHEVASKCGIPVNKIFNIEKGHEEDLEKWGTILAHISIAVGAPFTDIFGDYATCVSNPALVASAPGSLGIPISTSELAAKTASQTHPWKLTVGGRVRHAREAAKVSADLLTEMLGEGLGGDGITKEELEELEMCDSTAEDCVPILLYIVYRTGAPLASIVL